MQPCEQTQTKAKTTAKLVAELLSLDPPASTFCLVRVARYVWAEGDNVSKPIIEALTTRQDTDTASLRWLLKERPHKPYATKIAEAILRHPNRTYDDLRFLYSEIRIDPLRRRLADMLVVHKETSVYILMSISEDEGASQDARNLAINRIQVIRSSRDFQIMSQITGSF
jgi:hypothetical protein